MSETYRDLGGGIGDPDTPTTCHWRCDGHGMDRFVDIQRRPFVDCPAHPREQPAYARPGARRRKKRMPA